MNKIDFPKYNNLKIGILYTFLVIMAYLPVVFFGRTLQPTQYFPVGIEGIFQKSDIKVDRGRIPINTFNIDLATPAFYEWPINRFVGDQYLKGEIPIWNPYQAAGDPVAVQYSTRVFFPYQIIENISPVWTWDYFLLGRLWFSGFFTYLFLVSLGLSLLPAFLGGIFYMFSGSLVWFINLEQIANVAMTLPFMMFTLEKLVKLGTGTIIALAAISMALVLLGGQPETALYVIVLGGLYIGFRTLDLYGWKGLYRRPFFVSVLSGILALALASPLLLPFIEYMENAYHMHDPSRKLWLEGFPPLQWFIAVFIPTFFNVPIQHKIGPDNGMWDFLGGYTGILALILIIFPFFSSKSLWHKYLYFFFAVGTCILLKNFGVFPFYYIGALPLFDQTWSQRWAGPVWTFSLSIAAALSVEIIWDKKSNIPPLHIHKILNIIISGFIAFVLFTFHRNHFRVFASPFGENYDPNFVIPSIFIGCITAILTIIFASFILKNWSGSRSGLYALIALALNELWFVIPRGYDSDFLYFKIIPFFIGLTVVWELGKQRWKRASVAVILILLAYGCIDYFSPHGFPDRTNPFRKPPYVRFLKEQKGHFRVMGAGGVFLPNFASTIGLYDIGFISSLSVQTYHNFVNHFLMQKPLSTYNVLWFIGLSKSYSGPTVTTNVDRYIQDAENDIRAKIKFYSALGVKYFLLPTFGNLEKGDLENASFKLLYNREVKIYENLKALPKTFVVYNIQQVHNFETAQDLTSQENFDFKNQAIVEDKFPDISSYEIDGFGDSHSEITQYEARRVELKVRMSRPGLVVLTDVYYPGWEVKVDGETSKVYRVDGLFRGVFLSKGEHKVVFSYFPKIFKIGFVLAGISSLVCLCLVIFTIFFKYTRNGKLLGKSQRKFY